jgi:hypothetical protein
METKSNKPLPSDAYTRVIGGTEKLAILGAVLAGDSTSTVASKHGLPKLRVHTLVKKAGY